MIEQEYKYMVCTSCMTYNHAPYIVDAMNGFSMQKTSFPVYYIITDDASTDGEPDVICQYLSEYFQTPYCNEETDDYYLKCAIHNTNPNCIFVVFLLKYNHYSIRKSRLAYQSEWRDNAKYIALCEGDDYWIHPSKIQMQVDIMERNEHVGLVYGRARVFVQKEKIMKGVIGREKRDFDDLIVQNGIPTLTVVYRSFLKTGFEKIRNPSWRMGDFSLWLYIAHQSDIKYIDEITAVYRILEESASHSQDFKKQLAFLNSSAQIYNFFIEKYDRPDLKGQYKKKYFRLISFLYYTSGRRVRWSSIAPYICFDIKSILYIIASYVGIKYKG